MCYDRAIMKKSILLLMGMVLAGTWVWAQGSLGETYSRRMKPVAITVAEPTNHSEDTAFVPADFKKALEEALSARKTPKFTLVTDPAAAELALSVDVVESIYLEHDPVDKLIGLGGTAWDAMHDERYARVMAVFTVRDARSNHVLWTDKLKATVTDAKMTREESRPKVLARAAEIFIREAFGKKRS